MIIAKFEKIVIWTLLAIFLVVPTLFVPTKTSAQAEKLTIVASGASDVKLDWNEIPGVKVTLYVIERDGRNVGTNKTNSFIDKNVPDGIYKYQVQAFDDGLNSLGRTDIVTVTKKGSSVTVGAVTPKDAGSDVFFKVAASGDKDIQLSWNKAWESDGIATYQVKRNGQNVGPSIKVSTTQNLTYIDKDVPDGTYTYQVIALDASGKQISNTPIITITKAGPKVTVDSTTPDNLPPADGESCTKHCPGGTWWWKVDENIQNAICNMQCTIIDWESSMIGWVVAKVLYPALGLCIENDSTNPCPEPPNVTETK